MKILKRSESILTEMNKSRNSGIKWSNLRKSVKSMCIATKWVNFEMD